jgi:hypothetical protein
MSVISLLLIEIVRNEILHVQYKTQNAVMPFYKLTDRFKSNIPVNTRECFNLIDFLTTLYFCTRWQTGSNLKTVVFWVLP